VLEEERALWMSVCCIRAEVDIAIKKLRRISYKQKKCQRDLGLRHLLLMQQRALLNMQLMIAMLV